MIRVLACSLMLFAMGDLEAQSSNSYGLPMVLTLDEYRQTVALDSNKMMVEIAGFVPNVVLDIKYFSFYKKEAVSKVFPVVSLSTRLLGGRQSKAICS